MNEITFSSTFRLPVKQPGINKAKRARLVSLLHQYNNSLIGTGSTGYARISMPNDQDASFICNIKTIGYKIYQKFNGENISKNNLDDYIKESLKCRDFIQYGKQKASTPKVGIKPKSTNIKIHTNDSVLEETFSKKYGKKEKTVNTLENDNIRNSESYKDILKRYGVEFAEATFFNK